MAAAAVTASLSCLRILSEQGQVVWFKVLSVGGIYLFLKSGFAFISHPLFAITDNTVH